MTPQVIAQDSASVHIQVPIPRLHYLKNVMRSDSFDALWPLFKWAHDPCKEFTESYAAHHHLRQWKRIPTTVLHVGDGAHCRTGALFAFLTKHTNISIDPIVDVSLCGRWMHDFKVERFQWFRGRVEDYPLEQYAQRGEKVIVTFVHAHVDIDTVLDRLGVAWLVAYTNACCEPERQLGRRPAKDEGSDWAILSPERRYRVLVAEDIAKRGLR